MARRFFLFLALGLVGYTLVGCTHTETVVNLSAPNSSGPWSVRNHEGARLCSLPCRVELDPNQAIVVAREGGAQEFVVHQENLGAGSWSGTVRLREEPTAGALALRAFSSTLVTAGASLVDDTPPAADGPPTTRYRRAREDRIAAGIVLSGLGTVGMLASSAWPGKMREELWLERMATAP